MPRSMQDYLQQKLQVLRLFVAALLEAKDALTDSKGFNSKIY